MTIPERIMEEARKAYADMPVKIGGHVGSGSLASIAVIARAIQAAEERGAAISQQAEPVAWTTTTAIRDLDEPNVCALYASRKPSKVYPIALYTSPSPASDSTRVTVNPLEEHDDESLWRFWNNKAREQAAEIASLRSQLEEARRANEWKPIETAPKDLTDILLVDEFREAFIGYFSPEDDQWWDYQSCKVFPTHWRPRPAPPAAIRRLSEQEE